MAVKTSGPGLIYTHDNYVTQNNSDGNSLQLGPYTSLTGVDWAECSGERTVGYHYKKKTGELIPYTNWEQFEKKGSRFGNWRVKSVPYDSNNGFIQSYSQPAGRGDWTLSKADLSSFLSSYDGQAMVQAAAASLSSRGHDTLTAIVELKKTLRDFDGLIKRFIDLLKKTNKRRVINAWLEVRYAWRPLILDMIEFQKQVEELETKQSRAFATGRVGQSLFDIRRTETVVNHSAFTVTGEYVDKYTVSIRGAVCARYSVSSFSFNPIVTAWELIPFSFIVDWFVSVGTMLHAASAMTLSSSHTAAMGVKVDATRELEIHSVVPKPDRVVLEYNETIIHSASYTARVPTSVSFSPYLRLNFDTSKLLDLVAIVAGFKSLNRRY